MAARALHIGLSGRLTVRSGAQALAASDLPGRQGRLTLARLAMSPAPVERDVLAGLLWPDALPKSWERDLSAVVSKIRAALGRLGAGADALPLGGGAYELRLPAGSSVDVVAARAAVESAEAAEDGWTTSDLERAVVTLRAIFLPGETAAWVDEIREENRRWLVRALDAASTAAAAAGALDEAVTLAEEAVGVDPYREAGYAKLLRLQVEAGDRSGAARTFERCRRALVEELGVEPSATTTAILRDLARPDARSRPPFPPALAGRGGGFVGRLAELGRLERSWKQARAGDRQVVVVGGEAGIGKTRLAGAAAEPAYADGATVLYGRCDREPVVPFQPVVEALRSLARVDGASVRAELGAATGALVTLVPELGGGSDSGSDGSTGHDRLRMFDAFAAAFSAAGSNTILVLDDLQWATESTLLLIRHLVRHGAPMLTVCTYRDNEVSAGLAELLSWLDREPDVHHLVLSGLDGDEVAELIGAASGHADGRDPQSLQEATAGNPFFLTELLAHQPGAAPVPRAIRATVANRVAALGSDAGDVLLVGALAGRHFSVRVVEFVVGREITDAVDAAVRVRLLSDTDEAGYVAFVHDIVREAVLAEASALRRSRLHLALADAFERVEPQRVEDILRHLVAGAPHDGARIAIYALRAGLRAIERLAGEDAVALLEIGLEALTPLESPDHALLADTLLALGRAHLILGDRDAARAFAVRAADIGRRAMLPDRIGDAALLLFARGTVVGEPDRALVDAVNDALAALPAEASVLRAKLTAVLGEHTYSAEADEEGGQRLVNEALTLARASGDADARALALWTSVVTLNASPDVDRAADLVSELFSLTDALGVAQVTDALFMRMRLELVRANRSAAEECIRKLESIHAEHRLWASGWHLAEWDMVRSLLEGSFTEANRHLDRVKTVFAPYDPNTAYQCVGHEAFINLEVGELDHVIALTSAVVERAPNIPAFRAILCVALARSGDLCAAADHLAALVHDDKIGLARDVTWMAGMVLLAEASALVGSPDAARVLYRELQPFAGTTAVAAATVACLGAVDRYLGILCTVLGEHERALAHFAAAVAVEEGLSAPPLLARSRLWWARALIDRGDPDDAPAIAELLDEVLHISQRLGMAELSATAAPLVAAGRCLR